MSETHSSSQQIGARMVKGAAWMVLLHWSMRGVGLISTVVLARLLLPADFGLVGLAIVLLWGLEVLGGFGFDLAVIRDQNADRRTYDTAWTLIVLRGMALAVILVLCAPSAANFFVEPRLEPIMYLFAIGIFAEGFKNIGIVDFRKDLLFDKEFKYLLWSRLGQFVVTISLAFVWQSYWALVVGALSGNVLRLALSYLMHPYRPTFSLTVWRDIMQFSKWLVLNNVLNFIYLQSPALFLGKLIGVQTLGLYRVSYEIANLPTTQLMSPIVTATFPAFAKVAEEMGRLRTSFLDVLSIVLCIAAPLSVGLGLTAPHFVTVLLGVKWIEAIPLIQVLAVYGFLEVVRANSETVFLALGRPYLIAIVRGISAAIQLSLLPWSVGSAQAIGACWAITAAAGAALIVSLCLVLPRLKIRPREVVTALWRTTTATVLMAAAVVGVQLALASPDEHAIPAVLLASEVFTGLLVYVAAQVALWCLAGRPDCPERKLAAAVLARRGVVAAR